MQTCGLVPQILPVRQTEFVTMKGNSYRLAIPIGKLESPIITKRKLHDLLSWIL